MQKIVLPKLLQSLLRKQRAVAGAIVLLGLSTIVFGSDNVEIHDCSLMTIDRQITTARRDHVLTNVNVWSRDGSWIVYDIRPGDGSQFSGTRIEMVNASDCSVRLLYQSEKGAGCGVVTFNPESDLAIFILGPENPTEDWNYAFSRRRGVMVNINNPGIGLSVDAMNYAPPFAPGALRGGSHVHVFSRDGRMISFTYDDEILSRLDAAEITERRTTPEHQHNQRNVGVSVMGMPVLVNRNHPRNNDGECFSVLVTRTVNQPKPGSEEICRAFEEGWVGDNGYVRPDGRRQVRALAFQGTVTGKTGRGHSEVYIVDIPENITVSGENLIEGDLTRRPFPPKGTIQRRLTFTDGEKYPGVCSEPRHWLRSSPDGKEIAFLMKDGKGIVQVWAISPNGGMPRQVTQLGEARVESSFTWSPDGRFLGIIIDGSVCLVEMATGRVLRLTPKRTGEIAPDAAACVFSPDGTKLAYLRRIRNKDSYYRQICVVELSKNDL